MTHLQRQPSSKVLQRSPEFTGLDDELADLTSETRRRQKELKEVRTRGETIAARLKAEVDTSRAELTDAHSKLAKVEDERADADRKAQEVRGQLERQLQRAGVRKRPSPVGSIGSSEIAGSSETGSPSLSGSTRHSSG